MAELTLLLGDWIEQLKSLPDESIQCCVTSPPYWGLRSYLPEDHALKARELGREKTPEEYTANLVSGFQQVKRVLKTDGTLWLNLGDSYAHDGKRGGMTGGKQAYLPADNLTRVGREKRFTGLKSKDLVGIPWLVAFALRADAWWLRSEITWCKKVPMPESVRDRPTAATEKIFLLTKSPKYFYDADAVRNPLSESFANDPRRKTGATDVNMKDGYDDAKAQNPKKLHRMFDKQRGHPRRHAGFNDRWDKMSKEEQMRNGSNMRNFWLLGPQPYRDAHFATFPTEVPRKCILAGSRPGDTVLDPFGGSGTTGQVALELGRNAILIELNPGYRRLIQQRLQMTPGLAL